MNVDRGTPGEVAARLEASSPDALLLEPREFFDAALAGTTDEPKDHWPRQGGITVAVYDRERCVEAIAAWLGCDLDEAVEWYEFNTAGAWVGEGTPVFEPQEEDE